MCGADRIHNATSLWYTMPPRVQKKGLLMCFIDYTVVVSTLGYQKYQKGVKMLISGQKVERWTKMPKGGENGGRRSKSSEIQQEQFLETDNQH